MVAPVSEAELTSDVIGLADSLGLLWHHCPDSRRCKGNPGFPDLLVAGPRGLVLAELKSEHGETSADQDLWLWTLRQAEIEAIVARPGSLDWLRKYLGSLARSY